RHGNKGIVARVVPEEDMPFLPDGRPVDIVLNPLGVPSRMNVGQILETHLGWAARILGFYAKTPVFSGASEKEIGLLLRLAALSWAHHALELKSAKLDISDAEISGFLTELRPAIGDEKVELLHDANVNELGGRGMSAASKDLYHRVRDYIAEAAKEFAEREHADLRNSIAFHEAEASNEELSAARRADIKKAGKELERRNALSASELLVEKGFPALAVMVGRKADADVDEASKELIRAAGLMPGGKINLRDGRTGENFASPVTVGNVYMLKLSHLVDDKIHARSIGPYSLVT